MALSISALSMDIVVTPRLSVPDFAEDQGSVGRSTGAVKIRGIQGWFAVVSVFSARRVTIQVLG